MRPEKQRHPRLRRAAAVAGAVVLLAPAPPASDLAGVDPMVQARIEEVQLAVTDDPVAPERWLHLGRVYHAHQLTDPARESYLEAVRLVPGNPKAWYLLAHAQADLGEPQAALGSIGRAIELAPGYAPAHWRTGRWLLDLGRLEEAEKAFRRAVDTDPTALAGWVGLARIRLEHDDADSARAILERVLAADPANGVAAQLLGRAFQAGGQSEAARRALGMAAGMGAYFPDPWHQEMLEAATGVGNLLAPQRAAGAGRGGTW